MKIKSAIIFADTVDVLTARRSKFEHNHRRRVDRAPQNHGLLHARQATGSLAQIVGEAWTGPNRWRDGRESGVLVQAGGKPLDGTKS